MKNEENHFCYKVDEDFETVKRCVEQCQYCANKADKVMIHKYRALRADGKGYIEGVAHHYGPYILDPEYANNYTKWVEIDPKTIELLQERERRVKG